MNALYTYPCIGGFCIQPCTPNLGIEVAKIAAPPTRSVSLHMHMHMHIFICICKCICICIYAHACIYAVCVSVFLSVSVAENTQLKIRFPDL